MSIKPLTLSNGQRNKRQDFVRWSAWFSGGNFILLLLISFRYYAVAELPTSTLAKLFVTLMTISQLGIFCLAIFLLIVPVTLAIPNRLLATSWASCIGTIVTLILVIDTFVYQLYRFHLNSAVLSLLFGDAAQDIFVFSLTMYLQTAGVILAIFLVELLLASVAWRISRRSRGFKFGGLSLSCFAVALLTQNGLYLWADHSAYTPITEQASLLPGYFPVTAKKFLRRFGIEPVTGTQFSEIKSGGGKLNYPLSPISCRPPAIATKPAPNILILLIDSWVFHAFSEAVTPNVWQLSQKSLRFQNHFSGGSATRSGVFSLFYGIPATYWHAMLAERRGPVLISELLRQHYQMGIFASAALTSPEFDRTVFSEVPNLRTRSSASTIPEKDREITDSFISFLNTRDKNNPFFGFLFFDSPHSFELPTDAELPFQPSLAQVDYIALNNSYDATAFRNRYYNSVHFVDDLIRKILAQLEQSKLMDNTIILVSGDHGQEFNDNGLNYWGHNGNFSRFQTEVPLVVYWPGKSAQTIEYRTSHFDIAPTIMGSVLNCDSNPAEYSVGKDLLTPGGRELLLLSNYGQYAIVEPDSIDLFQPFGTFQALDTHYKPLPNGHPNPKSIIAGMELQSRFFKH